VYHIINLGSNAPGEFCTTYLIGELISTAFIKAISESPPDPFEEAYSGASQTPSLIYGNGP